MAAFTNGEKSHMILILGECHGNSRQAERLYRERYPEKRHPSAATIWKLWKCLEENGTFVKPRVQHPNERRLRLHEFVLAAVYANPQDSSRHIARLVGASHTTVLKILHKYHFRAYHVHLHQDLHGDDPLMRVYFCVLMKDAIYNNPNFLKFLLFSDESTFHRDGTVNRHNLHYWSPTNPFWIRERHHQQRWKVNVWCGILGDRVIGPYFFDQVLTGESYLQFLRGPFYNDVLAAIPPAERQQLWFQQDGAPPHKYMGVTEWLNNNFRGHWMGQYGAVHWPARSPDLTPLDFFLWGFLKEQVYETEPLDLNDLKERIRNAVLLVTPDMLKQVRDHIVQRLDDCLAADGGHFEQHY